MRNIKDFGVDARLVRTFRTKDGKGYKGWIYETPSGYRFYFSIRDEKKHEYRNWKSWGIDIEIFDEINKMFPLLVDLPRSIIIYEENQMIFYHMDWHRFAPESHRLKNYDGRKNCDGDQYQLSIGAWDMATKLSDIVSPGGKKKKTKYQTRLEDNGIDGIK